jgi:hypothetical protein
MRKAEMKKNKKYVALYSAVNEWTEAFEADDETDAYEKAEAILDDLYGHGPFDFPEEVSIDIYEVKDIDPDLDDGLDPLMNLIHLIRNEKGISDRRFAKMLLDGILQVWGAD